MLTVVLALAAVACGDDPDGIVADDATSFLALMPVAHCDHLTRCGRFDSVDGCLAHPATFEDLFLSGRAAIALGLYDPLWAHGVDRGTVDFSHDVADACLAALRAGSCTGVVDQDVDIGPCRRALRGTVPIGQPSQFPFECVSGQWVDDATCQPSQACCSELCGEPLPRPGLPDRGEPCGPPGCRRGLVCTDGTCAPGPGPGEACALDDECPAAHVCDDGACAPGHRIFETCLTPGPTWCSEYAEVCVEGACTVLRGRGEPCGTAARCQLDLRCDGASGRCVTTPASAPPPIDTAPPACPP
jgi:hypothetical protein